MEMFCANCGKQLNKGESCNCKQAKSKDNSLNAGTTDVKAFSMGLWNTVLSFSKNPIGVVCGNVNSSNIVTASAFIVLTAFFQAISGPISYFKAVRKLDLTMFFKPFIIHLLLFGAIVLALYGFSKLVNKSKSDLMRTFTAVGIAAIPMAAAAVVTFVLSIVISDLDSIIMTFARVFTFFTVLMAIKQIDQIKKEEYLIYIAALTGASYSFANLVLYRLFY